MADDAPVAPGSTAPPVPPPARAPARRAGHRVALAVVRLTEVTMVAIGFGYVFWADDTGGQDLGWLAAFDLVAGGYLLVGLVVVRRAALRGRGRPGLTVGSSARTTGGAARRPLRERAWERFAFTMTVIASLTGLGGAFAVVNNQDDPGTGQEYVFLGVVAVICAWMLLHVGYARFYRQLYYRGDGHGGGLAFPDSPAPSDTDFLYFAFTCGVSFAPSDVTVVTTRMRWHVLVHVVLSFFYNAAVLTIAISTVTSSGP